jgi:hypothetical protein
MRVLRIRFLSVTAQSGSASGSSSIAANSAFTRMLSVRTLRDASTIRAPRVGPSNSRFMFSIVRRIYRRDFDHYFAGRRMRVRRIRCLRALTWRGSVRRLRARRWLRRFRCREAGVIWSPRSVRSKLESLILACSQPEHSSPAGRWSKQTSQACPPKSAVLLKLAQ